jgi:hypothetical protein
MKTLFFIVLAFASVGCSGQTTANQTAPAAVPAATPRSISTADLANLKWIEGAWKGTGDVEKPFFELYRFEDDSTLAVDSFYDESLSKVTETSRFVLKDGQFASAGEGSRYAATDITKDSITFAPIVKAGNTFIWRKKSADLWEAVLEWPATESKPAMKRVYQMARIPMSKK